jgi:TRAP-type C4-dicarboxylate transport system permease small subunit
MNKESAALSQKTFSSIAGSSRALYLVGAVAAVVAALGFRRNLAVEITMLTAQSPPSTAVDWFTLLQNDRLLGLSFLNVFDIVNYAMVGAMFLAVYAALRQTSRLYMATATSLGIAGIAIYFVTNTAFSMLSLSSQYSYASTGGKGPACYRLGRRCSQWVPPAQYTKA